MINYSNKHHWSPRNVGQANVTYSKERVPQIIVTGICWMNVLSQVQCPSTLPMSPNYFDNCLR